MSTFSSQVAAAGVLTVRSSERDTGQCQNNEGRRKREKDGRDEDRADDFWRPPQQGTVKDLHV